MLICTITLSNMIYMYTRHIAPLKRSRGSAWLFHVAPSATLHPRGPARKLTERIDVVVNCTPIRVNNNSKLTNDEINDEITEINDEIKLN